MKHTKILIILLIVGLIALAGCSQKYPVADGKSRVAPITVENDLMQKIGKGQLVAVYDTELIISNDVKKDNYLIIKNAYKEVRDFKIESCAGCEIMNELKIKSEGYHIIPFSVEGQGEKIIIVTDAYNNHYGKATFTVTRGY